MEYNKDEVIYFAFSYIKSGGGAEKQILMQAQTLIENGFSVMFLCKEIDKNHFYKYCPSGKYSTEIFKILFEANKNIVISFLAHDHKYCLLFKLLGKIRWIPFERTHPEYYLKYSTKNFLYRYFKFSMLNLIYAYFSNSLIVQTIDAKEAWKKAFFKYKKPIYNLGNIIKESNIINNNQFDSNLLKIIMIGRLIKIKDYPIALKAFNILKEKNINFNVSIFGEGPEYINLVQMVKNFGLEKNIFFKGYFKDVDKEIIKHDIFLITSMVEGMPNALGEAMISAVPCITLNYHANPKEFLGDDNMQIVLERNPELLAERIIQFFDKNILKKYGEMNFLRAKSLFSEECYLSKFKLIYNLITDGKNYT